MARNIDLTGKLGFEEKPTVTVGETVLTVDNSAANVLRLMELIGEGGMGVKEVLEASRLIFEAKSAKALEKMGLSFADYATVVTAAIDLVMGDDGGNAETPATT